MAGIKITCAHCGHPATKEAGAVNRAMRAGLSLYCGLKCAGLARRVDRTATEKKARKAEYDRVYRAEQGETRRAKKREYHRRTYSYESGRAFREKRGSAYHTNYCREYYADPAKKAAKVDYDRKRRAELEYGPFADAAMLLVDLEKEIRRCEPDKYERAKARGYYERTAQQRKRNAGISRW